MATQRGALVSLLIFFQLFYASYASVSQCLVCGSNQEGCVEGSLQYIANCSDGSDACFTSVTDGVLLRGCLSHSNCTKEEGHACISCSENGCNNVSWLRCAHCNNAGPESCTVTQLVSFCAQYRSTDRCYEIVESVESTVLKPIAKGCESSLVLAGKQCDEQNRCILGRNSTNCNVQTALKQPAQCLVCSSEDDSNDECVKGTIPAQNCAQENDVCFSRLEGNVLERNCLSTLPTPEQDVCTGEDSTCITCNDPGCNTDHLLKCIQCKKSDNIECIDLVISSTLDPTFCSNFLPNARCFSRILENDLERGCSSESAAICDGNNRCLSCESDGCNVESETYLNDVAKCFRCSSNNGDNTVCDEVHLGAEECDQLEDSCFSRVEGDILERNCLLTLAEDDQQKCRNVEDTSCYSCTGHGCNQYPRIKCYRCSSLLDPRCTNPEETDLEHTFCDSFLPDDRCYARIVDDNVQRGCEVDLANNGEDVCAGNPMCIACHTSGCNGVDENELRNMAMCISCSTERDGEECDKATMNAQECDDFEDVCYTRVVGENLQRGCLQMLEESEQVICRDTSDPSCVTCQSPSCNNQLWLKCLKCKKSESADCVDPPAASLNDFASFCSKFEEQGSCYARITNDDFERGCSVELANPADVCTGNVACETCTTENCNVQTEDSLKSTSRCVQCTSMDENYDCNEQFPEATLCPEKIDKCFTRIFDGILTRSCLSLLEDTEQQKCLNPNDRSCIVCEEPGCNRNHWAKCHQCDQSISNDCVSEQPESDAEFCKSYSTDEKCFTKIDQNKQLARGCLSDVGTEEELCGDAATCVTCAGDSCNKLPETSFVYRKCQQCTSADVKCLLGTIESQPCPVQDDLCYTTVNSVNLLERGCLSMLSVEMQASCKNETDPSCIVCSEDGCNELRWPKCYRCQSSPSDESCDRQLVPDLVKFCSSYHESTLCYAAVQDGFVTRDCTIEQVNICDGNNRCVACSEEGCNDLPKHELDVVHTCYHCRSDVDDCDNLIADHVQECRDRTDRCFTRVDTDLNLHRGCVSDIEPGDCDNSERCLICSDNDCNNDPWASCFQCSNATSEECSSKQTTRDNLKYCQRHGTRGECYAMLNQMEFIRGCTPDLDAAMCDYPNECIQCEGDGCNQGSSKSYFNPAHCMQCHSDIHIGCTNGTASPAPCDDPDDVCFYRRASSKAIHRGCLSELTATNQMLCQSSASLTCHTCDGNGCNTPTWRSCYTCSSVVEDSCKAKQTDDIFLDFCVKIDDDCFEDNNDGDVNRGCGRHYCAHKQTCVECASDGCNSQPEADLRPSHCLVCDSTDPYCANGTSTDQFCEHLNEPCFTMVGNDDILVRGCFATLEDPYKRICLNESDSSCIVCNGNSCNREPWRQCVQCRSLELDHYCSRATSVLKSHFCPRFRRNDLCYAKDVNGIVMRGCQSDYIAMENPCKGLDSKDCYICSTDHCNLKSLNGVNHVKSPAILMFVVLAIVHGFLILL
ncbi:proprotein convertase subtilisin/kexin type 5-like [Anopheles maculipalpis]|uniref:proprotein convertase subtilisin/kexin type 5-like n=1 Tax=Anopheles maculipalpis TaxID=1496333 RepID=UPI002158BC18|nr:proprotein convertase subtilisin/kexin type 5-like [Anopheles maculipalpis]